MTEQRKQSGVNWQFWAGIIVFLGTVATIAVAFVESWAG
jgi:hypothetical protein